MYQLDSEYKCWCILHTDLKKRGGAKTYCSAISSPPGNWGKCCLPLPGDVFASALSTPWTRRGEGVEMWSGREWWTRGEEAQWKWMGRSQWVASFQSLVWDDFLSGLSQFFLTDGAGAFLLVTTVHITCSCATPEKVHASFPHYIKISCLPEVNKIM